MKTKTEWDYSKLTSSNKEKEFAENREKIKKESEKFVSKWSNRTDYLENPKAMKEALEEYELLEENYGSGGNEYYYYWLKTHIDENNPELKAKYNKIEEFAKEIGNKTLFFELKIGKIPEEKQKQFLKDQELKKYKHFLERIFKNSKHMLSEPEEKIMNLKSSSSHSLWVKMTSSFIAKEEREVLNEQLKKEKKNFPEITNLMNSQNKKVRDAAAKAFNEILEKHSDVAESEMNAILANHKVNMSLRNYSRPDEPRHVSDDIETEVVDALIKTVEQNFDISKRFYKLKAKLLGQKKLEYHERNVPIGKTEKEFSFEESKELIEKVFSRLDKKFSSLLRMFLEQGSIDVYPKKGKSSGAFCVHILKSQPTYIMLNHTNKLRDVTTFAHELGHAINNELIKEKQNALYFDTPKATAEVASTFMEDFVLEELTKESDEELKLSLIMEKLNDDVSSIIRQIACYKLEKELHSAFSEKGHLSKEEIGKIFQKNMFDYMGEFVEKSPGSENWWIYWGHLRMFFYVYSYSSGLLISKAMQKKVRKDPKFIENVKEFLSAGTSDSPKNIFLKMGIDITKKEFWESGLKEVDSLLNQAESLAKKLGKI